MVLKIWTGKHNFSFWEYPYEDKNLLTFVCARYHREDFIKLVRSFNTMKLSDYVGEGFYWVESSVFNYLNDMNNVECTDILKIKKPKISSYVDQSKKFAMFILISPIEYYVHVLFLKSKVEGQADCVFEDVLPLLDMINNFFESVLMLEANKGTL